MPELTMNYDPEGFKNELVQVAVRQQERGLEAVLLMLLNHDTLAYNFANITKSLSKENALWPTYDAKKVRFRGLYPLGLGSGNMPDLHSQFVLLPRNGVEETYLNHCAERFNESLVGQLGSVHLVTKLYCGALAGFHEWRPEDLVG